MLLLASQLPEKDDSEYPKDEAKDEKCPRVDGYSGRSQHVKVFIDKGSLLTSVSTISVSLSHDFELYNVTLLVSKG